jgi:hypothetical protein
LAAMMLLFLMGVTVSMTVVVAVMMGEVSIVEWLACIVCSWSMEMKRDKNVKWSV